MDHYNNELFSNKNILIKKTHMVLFFFELEVFNARFILF